MHPSSLKNMREARNRWLSVCPGMQVLDVGGRGLSGDRSYRSIFQECLYHIADVCAGENVTHVMPGPFELPFPDNSIDLVVSGQMLEHCQNPFRSVAEMVRVLRPGHRLVLIAPSAGPKHDDRDGWRFMDDAFIFIAEDVGLTVVADWIDNSASDARSSKWRDHVFVGQKP